MLGDRSSVVEAPGRSPARPFAVRAGGLERARLLQLALALMWLVDSALQYQPFMFGRSFVSQVIAPNEVGQPGFVAAPIGLASHLIEPRVVVFNALAASIQLVIGLGLLYRPAVKAALLVSSAWALGVWWIGEGLGGLLTGTASPLTGAPGAALLYVFVGLLAWPQPGVGARSARRAWAVLWAGSALLWLLPSNRAADGVSEQIAAAPAGMGWLTSIHTALADAAAGHGLAVACVAATLSMIVGVSLPAGRLERPALALAAAIALAYFVVGQGMGGILTGSGTDPGSGPLLLVLAAALYAFRERSHLPSRRSRERGRSLLWADDGRYMAAPLPGPGTHLAGVARRAPGKRPRTASSDGRSSPVADAGGDARPDPAPRRARSRAR